MADCSGRGYGLPVDVWAAGVLLFLMLTGSFPYHAKGSREMMVRRAAGEPATAVRT